MNAEEKRLSVNRTISKIINAKSQLKVMVLLSIDHFQTKALPILILS
jgi:hypothetical protein